MRFFRKYASRLAAALAGHQTPEQEREVISGLDFAAAESRILASQAKGGADLSGRSNIAPPAFAAPYGSEQRLRSHGNRRFHAKRGGAQQYGTVAHDMANSKAWQLMNNPLLQKLLFVKGMQHMNAQYPGADVKYIGHGQYEVTR